MRIPILGILALVVVLAASCSKEELSPTEELKELRAQRSDLDGKIQALEGKIRANSSADAVMTPVTVHTVFEAPFQHDIQVKGLVDSRSSVLVTSRTGGQIVKINVSNGQSVSRGQVLVELDAEVVKRSVEELEIQIEYARTIYEKQKRIYEQKAGSEVQFLAAKNQLEALEKRQASLNEQLAMSRIVATTSGTVDNLTPRVGENVAPGMPLMTIVNNSDTRIIVELAESYLNTVNSGDPVTIVFPETNDTVRTRISVVAKSVSTLNRTFKAEIPINGSKLGVRPNTTCNITITDEILPSALAVPLSAIVRDNSKAHVFVVGEKNTVEKRDVQLGMVSGSMVQVISGVLPKDRVVVRGVLDIAPGQVVNVTP